MPVIELQHLRKRYRDHVAVHDISFDVEEGEIFGVLGPNGAGKTTTVECIEGLRSPDGGTISVLGLDPQRDRTALRRVLGIQLQAAELPEKLRVAEAAEARRDTWAAIEQIRDGGVTVVLVTHFMEEAQRLCDRVAVIDSGRVVAVDTPAGLVAAVAGGQRLRFRPSEPFRDVLLTDLPEVQRIDHAGPYVEVTGHGDLLAAVTAALARHRIVAAELRADHATLDDAFVALTGQKVTP